MRTIQLTQDVVALVDDEDYERLSSYSWYVHPSGLYDLVYARTNAPFGQRGEYKAWYMHRMVMGVLDKPDVQVHHKDGNGLHNFKSNLQVMDTSEHRLLHGRVRSDSTTGVRGVTYNKKRRKYRARIVSYSVEVYDQYFETLEEAAAAIAQARKNMLGE